MRNPHLQNLCYYRQYYPGHHQRGTQFQTDKEMIDTWDLGVGKEDVSGRVSSVVSGIEEGLVIPWSYSSDDVDLLLSHYDPGGDVGTSSLAGAPVVNGTLSDTVGNTLFGGEISRIFEVPFVEEDFGPLFDSCREAEIVGKMPLSGELEGAGEKKNSVAGVVFSEQDMPPAGEVVESKRLGRRIKKAKRS